MRQTKRKQVYFKKDGFGRDHLWSYHIKYVDGTYWMTSGFKTKASAIRDYRKQKRI